MCGRFSRREPPSWEDYHNALRIIRPQAELDVRPHFNIAPGTTKPIVITESEPGVCVPRNMKWGYQPHWSKRQFINARDDALFVSKSTGKRSMWASDILKRRCLIFADGYYEPEGEKGPASRPWHFFQREDAGLFAFGGLWTSRKDEESGEAIDTFAIITTAAPSWMEPIHGRNPFIVEPADWAAWLDPAQGDQAFIEEIVRPYDGPAFEHWKVSDRAKSPKNDDEGCIEPAAA